MLIFVYGTLKRGQRNHDLLAGAAFIRTARTLKLYQLYDLGPYPALVEAEPGEGETIDGEVYDVPDDLLKALDDFEGCPSLYRRAAVQLDGIPPSVEAYFYQRPIPPHCPTGPQWPMYLA